LYILLKNHVLAGVVRGICWCWS